MPLMGYWDNKEEKKNDVGRYEDAGSPEWILKFIKRGSAKGNEMEKFLIHSFDCIDDYDGESDLTAFDYILQVKTSSIWANGKSRWQHVEPDHDWEVLLLVIIDYHSIELHLMCRDSFEEMREDLGDKIKQGNENSYQGYWFWDDQADPYMSHFLSITHDPSEGEMDCSVFEDALNNCFN